MRSRLWYLLGIILVTGVIKCQSETLGGEISPLLKVFTKPLSSQNEIQLAGGEANPNHFRPARKARKTIYNSGNSLPGPDQEISPNSAHKIQVYRNFGVDFGDFIRTFKKIVVTYVPLLGNPRYQTVLENTSRVFFDILTSIFGDKFPLIYDTLKYIVTSVVETSVDFPKTRQKRSILGNISQLVKNARKWTKTEPFLMKSVLRILLDSNPRFKRRFKGTKKELKHVKNSLDLTFFVGETILKYIIFRLDKHFKIISSVLEFLLKGWSLIRKPLKRFIHWVIKYSLKGTRTVTKFLKKIF